MGSAAFTMHICADPPSSAVFLRRLHSEHGVNSRICSYRIKYKNSEILNIKLNANNFYHVVTEIREGKKVLPNI
jgi:hypothetical protein